MRSLPEPRWYGDFSAGLTTGQPGFDYRYGLRCDKAAFGADPAIHPLGARQFSPRGEGGQSLKPSTSSGTEVFKSQWLLYLPPV